MALLLRIWTEHALMTRRTPAEASPVAASDPDERRLRTVRRSDSGHELISEMKKDSSISADS